MHIVAVRQHCSIKSTTVEIMPAQAEIWDLGKDMSRQQRNYAEWEPSEKPVTTMLDFTCFSAAAANLSIQIINQHPHRSSHYTPSTQLNSTLISSRKTAGGDVLLTAKSPFCHQSALSRTADFLAIKAGDAF
jgi:hypothetical protein